MNLIIGAAIGYELKDVKNFVISLRKFFKDEVILIFNNNITEETNFFLNQYNIKLFISKTSSNKAFVDRYEVYLKIITKFKKLSRVMISDVRDVYFQRDPFKNKLFYRLNFFLEDKFIKDCPTNSKWINRIYGSKELNKLNNKYISCSGITLGFKKNMIQYLKSMVFQIKNNKYLTLNPKSKGWDQGNHNYVVNLRKFSYAKKYSNQVPFVATLAQSNIKNFIIKKKFLNFRNMQYDIVHQYDRHISKFKKILKNILS